MERPLISVSGLSKYYLENMPVLKDINFNIESGEFVAIMGHSGSGKSTLMNILGCLDTATDGHYYLEGRDTAALNADELALLQKPLDRVRFSRIQLVAEKLDFGQYRFAVALCRQEQGRAARKSVYSCWIGSAWLNSASAGRINCRAGNSSAWPSPGHWSPTPN